MLSKEENDLLRFIYQKTTPLPFTKLARKMNISIRQLYKLVGTLTRKGLVTETQINLKAKTRKSRIIILTADGIAALGYPQPAGKGGPAHQYFQRLIKDFAQKQGYAVEIEKHIGNQKTVDLSLEQGEEKTAIEISITTNAVNEFDNIKKCLAAPYDRIFILCSRQNTVDNLERLVDQNCHLAEKAKINFLHLQHLFRLSFRTK
jgi:DNA-binding Lrp family transcriptional regulator